MSLSIAQLGQPVLRQKAEDIPPEEINTIPFQKFIDDMLLTVHANHGIGLAGPQVFSHRRIFVAGVLPPPDENAMPEMEVFINPRITAASEQVSLSWEGCLSFPELLVLVARAEEIRIEYLNRRAEPQAMDLKGIPARVVQHEYDHLDGILTIDRAPSTRWIVKASEIEAANAELEEMLQKGSRKDAKAQKDGE